MDNSYRTLPHWHPPPAAAIPAEQCSRSVACSGLWAFCFSICCPGASCGSDRATSAQVRRVDSSLGFNLRNDSPACIWAGLPARCCVPHSPLASVHRAVLHERVPVQCNIPGHNLAKQLTAPSAQRKCEEQELGTAHDKSGQRPGRSFAASSTQPPSLTLAGAGGTPSQRAQQPSGASPEQGSYPASADSRQRRQGC